MTPERAKARDEFRDHGNKITNSTGPASSEQRPLRRQRRERRLSARSDSSTAIERLARDAPRDADA
jgi:hypothetical protein